MGKRGLQKKPLSIIKPSEKLRPNPQRGMTQAARIIWERTVSPYPPDHFKPQNYGVLRSYCEAEADHNLAQRKINKLGHIIEQQNGVIKENPWVNVKYRASAAMTRDATKLGITVNATSATRGKSGEAPKPKSKREGLMYGGRK